MFIANSRLSSRQFSSPAGQLLLCRRIRSANNRLPPPSRSRARRFHGAAHRLGLVSPALALRGPLLRRAVADSCSAKRSLRPCGASSISACFSFFALDRRAQDVASSAYCPNSSALTLCRPRPRLFGPSWTKIPWFVAGTRRLLTYRLLVYRLLA